MEVSVERKTTIVSRIIKALASFTVSYAFVIIFYVFISNLGIFDPIDNRTAVQLMYTCLAVALVHFILGFFHIKSNFIFFLLYFGVEAVIVLFMGFLVYDFFIMNAAFFVWLTGMLIAVFAGTYLIAYYEDWKKVQEINEIIRQTKKSK